MKTGTVMPLFVALTVLFAAISAFEYSKISNPPMTAISSTTTVTKVVTTTLTHVIVTSGPVNAIITTASSSQGDIFLTNCSVTGIGGFELRVVSDSTGTPVVGENITAVDTLGCNAQTQVVHITDFTTEGQGWLIPVFPPQAEPGGRLNFAVAYQGQVYYFAASVPPIGTNCVTLQVPSGTVTSKTVMNGSGSYCSQG